MARYTLHLAFQWNSPQIGALWDADHVSPHRFLQYALGDANGAPAWFELDADDVIDVLLWDLTPSSQVASVSLAMSFGPLIAPADATAIAAHDPADLVTLGDAMAVAYANGQPYLAFSGIRGDKATESPWGRASQSWSAGSFTLSSESRYKLSFLVTATPASSAPAQTYLSDPEVIVGSTG